jgi:hypothetical protein
MSEPPENFEHYLMIGPIRDRFDIPQFGAIMKRSNFSHSAGGTPMSQQADGPGTFFGAGKDQTGAMLNMQKDLLDAYEQASRAWLARVKSEVDLWSELARKLGATRSAPEAMEVYQQTVAQRMQMAAEDGQRLSEECQKIMGKLGHSLTNGWPKGGST